MTTGIACKKCGEPVTAGARFCMTCGNDVSGQQGGVQTGYMPSQTQQFQRGLMDALRDATLGEYEILAELGQGGMASVYLAHDIALDRKVAIKVMSPHLLSGEGMVERFKQEARTAAGLSHPHIIPIFAVKQVGDLLFFVMKFIEGRALDEIIKEGAPLPEQLVRQIISRVAEALGYAHRNGVVHRDIKPANIMIDTEGTPIVTDFGIAKVASKQGLTMTGATIGTPTYMSPEQCNALPITGASDQYSLGVMVYEMLTGKTLFDGDSVMTIMFKHVHEEPPQPAEFGPSVPVELAEACRRMLRKEVDERYPNMEAVASAFQSTLAIDSPERKQLVAYAMKGENRTILHSVKTPRSPIPSAGHKQPTRARTAAQGDATVVTGTQAPARKRWPLVVGIAVALTAGASSYWALVLNKAAPVEAAAPASAPVTTSAPPEAAVPQQTAAEPPVQTAAPAPTVTRPTGPAPVAGVRIAGSGGLQLGGEPAQLSVTLTDASGQPLSGRPVRWTSSDPRVATVSQAGLVTPVSVGSATVTAASENRTSAPFDITVSEEGVRSVAMQPTVLTVEAGQNALLAVQVTGTSGGRIDRPVAWSSSNAQVATVDAAGRVTGVAAGSAIITANVQGQSASATVTVNRREITEAEHRQLITGVIGQYGAALQSKDVDAVKDVYPSLSAQREQQLRQALPGMQDLQVTLNVGGVTVRGTTATAAVTGEWRFRLDGRGQTLPANNSYTLRYQNDRWVITDIQ